MPNLENVKELQMKHERKVIDGVEYVLSKPETDEEFCGCGDCCALNERSAKDAASLCNKLGKSCMAERNKGLVWGVAKGAGL